jgi:hypothetical protein
MRSDVMTGCKDYPLDDIEYALICLVSPIFLSDAVRRFRHTFISEPLFIDIKRKVLTLSDGSLLAYR